MATIVAIVTIVYKFCDKKKRRDWAMVLLIAKAVVL